MQNTISKNKIIWNLISIVLGLACILAIINLGEEFSIKAFADSVRNASPAGLAGAFICMFGFIFFEGEAIRSILKSLGYSKSIRQGTVYSAADIYVSAITPSASGGQPASALFMAMDGIPVAVITVTLLVNLIMYTVSLMLVGAFCLVVRPRAFTHFNAFSQALIVIGFIMLTGLLTVFILLLRNKQLFRKLCKGTYGILKKIRIFRHPKRVLRWMVKMMKEYGLCSEMLDRDSSGLFKAFVCNFLQRVSQISVTMVTYLAMGGAPGRAFDIWATQSFVVTGSNCVPIPGAMGAADYLMLDGFSGVATDMNIKSLELLSRGISFYSCILISGAIMVVSYALHKWREKNDRDL